MSESAGNRFTEMLQQGYDIDVVRRAADLERGEADLRVVEVQNFLKHYGYLDWAPVVALGVAPEPGRLDDVTVRALTEFRMRYDVGTPGVLDAPTRELMAAPRCGMPDLVGRPTVRFGTVCAWDRRNLSYQFGRQVAPSINADLPQGITVNAVAVPLIPGKRLGWGYRSTWFHGGDIPIDADIRIVEPNFLERRKAEVRPRRPSIAGGQLHPSGIVGSYVQNGGRRIGYTTLTLPAPKRCPPQRRHPHRFPVPVRLQRP